MYHIEKWYIPYMEKSVLVISKSSSPWKGGCVSSCSYFSRWGGGRALHLKCSTAGNSVTGLEEIIPKCSRIFEGWGREIEWDWDILRRPSCWTEFSEPQLISLQKWEESSFLDVCLLCSSSPFLTSLASINCILNLAQRCEILTSINPHPKHDAWAKIKKLQIRFRYQIKSTIKPFKSQCTDYSSFIDFCSVWEQKKWIYTVCLSSVRGRQCSSLISMSY